MYQYIYPLQRMASVNEMGPKRTFHLECEQILVQAYVMSMAALN